MIVRILEEGQFEIKDELLDSLNVLDEKLVSAISVDDRDSFSSTLHELLAIIRYEGTRMPDDYLGPSELVLPGPDATIAEVGQLLSGEGLIPG